MVSNMQMNVLSKNLKTLLETMGPDYQHKDGGLNVGKIALELGMNAPTLRRLLWGRSERMRPENEATIGEYFSIDAAALYKESFSLNPTEQAVQEFISEYEALPKELQSEVYRRLALKHLGGE